MGPIGGYQETVAIPVVADVLDGGDVVSKIQPGFPRKFEDRQLMETIN